MTRVEEFRQRLQSFKKAREQDPGLSYLDWKVKQYQQGGITDVPPSIDGLPVPTKDLLYGISPERRSTYIDAVNWQNNWNIDRLATGRFEDQLGHGLLEQQANNMATVKPTESARSFGTQQYMKLGAQPIVKKGATPEESLKAKIDFNKRAKDYGLQTEKRLNNIGVNGEKIYGEYNRRAHNMYLAPDTSYSTMLHELTHASQGDPQEAKIREIFGTENDSSTPYLDRPTEIRSRLQQLRKANNIDPKQIWNLEDLKQFKKTANDFKILNRYDEDKVLKLFNDVALNKKAYTNGRQIATAAYGDDGTGRSGYDPRLQSYVIRGNKQGWELPNVEITPRNSNLAGYINRRNNSLGRSVGRELAYSTPVLGDALVLKDSYNDFKDKNYLSAALGLLGLVLPAGVYRGMKRQLRKPIRGYADKVASTVTRYKTKPFSTVESKINRLLSADGNGLPKEISEEARTAANSVYNKLKTPEALLRVQEIDKQFGTNYTSTYNDLLNRYTSDTFMSPTYDYDLTGTTTKAQFREKTPDKMYLNPDFYSTKSSTKDFKTGLIRHEAGHAVDYQASPNKSIKDNKYLQELSNPSKYRNDLEILDDNPGVRPSQLHYIREGTEVKSHMNAFKDYLEYNGKAVKWTPSKKKTFENVLRKASKEGHEYMKLLYDSYKDKKQFFKDFNTIPIVSSSKANKNLV